MAKYTGRLVKLGIGRETVRGAGVAPTFQVPRTSFSFDDKVVKARSIGGVGTLADSEEAFVVTKYGQGDIEAEIRVSSFGLFLYGMLGTLSTAGVVDSSYTHSFSLANSNQHQSLAFLVVDENTTEMYKLVMLDSLEMVAELDEVVMFNASFMGKLGTDSGAAIAAMAAESKFTKKHLAFKIAANLGGIAAASTISLKSLNIAFSKNVTLDDVHGTAEPEDILNRQISIEGSFTLNYEDETYKNYMRDNTSRAMEIKWSNTDDLIGASTRPSLTMQFPKVDFFDWEPAYDLDEIVTQTVSFKASRDVSGGNALISTCDLVNDTASY